MYVKETELNLTLQGKKKQIACFCMWYILYIKMSPHIGLFSSVESRLPVIPKKSSLGWNCLHCLCKT